MSEHSMSELIESSDKYLELGANDESLRPELVDPGEREVEYRAYTKIFDKNGVGQVSAALDIVGDGDYETVWYRMGLPNDFYKRSANRIRIQQIEDFGKAFKIPGESWDQILNAIEEGEGKGNVAWALLGVDSYTNPDTKATTQSNAVEKFIIK